MSQAYLLQCADLAVVRGTRCLLSQLNWQVKAGELWQIKGDNGAGKTSLMRAIAGLAPQSLEGSLDLPSDFLFLGHKTGVKSDFTALENLRLHLGHTQYRDDRSLHDALGEVGLGDYHDEYAYRLSAGQQRRIALAQLFLSKSSLWLLDEPLTAIDVDGVAIIEACIERQVRSGGSVVYTSHQSLKLELSTRTLHLRGRGQLPDVS